MFNALGLTEEEMRKPLVGIVSSYNEIVPGHMNLDKIVEAVKLGVAMAGGTPVVFPAIAVCDGIAMGHLGMKYSLVTRDLIADSTECMALAHQFDALVMVPNCDKNVPGLLMAAARDQCADRIRQRRTDAGRKSPRAEEQSFQHVRSSWLLCGGHDDGGGRDGIREQGMSDLRFLLRYVYGQQHELSDGSARHGTEGQRYHSRPYIRSE